MAKIKVGGIMVSDGRGLLRIMSVPNRTDAPGIIFFNLGRNGINIELMAQTTDLDETSSFSLVVAHKDLSGALSILQSLKTDVQAESVSYVPDVSVLSIFGPHLREKPKIPGLMFAAIASIGISPLAVSTSISSVSCVLESAHLDPILEVLNETFDIQHKVLKRAKEW
jgi:aspartokinase